MQKKDENYCLMQSKNYKPLHFRCSSSIVPGLLSDFFESKLANKSSGNAVGGMYGLLDEFDEELLW